MVAADTSTSRAHGRGASGRESKRRTRVIYAALLAALSAAVMAIAAPTASAAPFQCDAFGYLFQNPSSSVHNVQQIDLATGESTVVGNPSDGLNAVGYNSLDDFFYAWDLDTSEIVRVNDDLSLDHLGVPAGVDATHVYLLGDVDAAGHYWMRGQDDWYEIDLTTPTPTVLASGTATNPPGVWQGGADWAWVDGGLYSVANDRATHEAHLWRFNPATGANVDLTPNGLGFKVTIPATGASDGSGAVYADANGFLYASFNGTGQIWRIDPRTHEAIKVADGPPSESNDGARCALAPIPTITVTKTVDGRVRPADQFTVGLLMPDGSAATSATTSGSARTASTTDFPASQGKTYTITDATTPASRTPSSEYVKSIVCKDGDGNTVVTGGSAGRWTLNVAEATTYACNVTNKAQADLALAKSGSPPSSVPGTNETYTLELTNNGPSTAINARLSDPLPSGLTFVSASQGCALAGATVTCDAGDLAPGASKTFTVTAKVGADATGRLENTATATSDTPDPNPPNNTSTTTTPLTPQADVSIAKTASTSPVVPGENEVYTLKVTNNGPSTATNVAAADKLPKGLTFVSAGQGCTEADGTVTCAAGSLDPGVSKSFEVTAKVASSVEHAVDNTATVTSDTPDPDGGNNKTTTHTPIKARADLSIAKTPSLSTIGAGGQVLYTLVVKNKGPSDATRVKVSDDAPASLALVSVKASQGSCKIADGKLSCMLFKIQRGGSAQVLVTATTDPAASGELSNQASVTGDQNDPDPKNNNDTGTITVTPSPPAPAQPTADLQIRKRVNHHKATVGQQLRYTIVVTNDGPAAATGVKLADTISRRVRIRSVRADQGSCKKGNPLSCTLGTIASGDAVTITVVVVPRETGGLRNAASATGEGLDPKTANNLVAVRARVRKPKLRVSKRANHKRVKPGQLVTYRIRVRNPSGRAVRKVRVCDRLPSGLSYVRATHKGRGHHGRRVCWSVKRLRAHHSKTFKVVVRVRGGAKGRKVNRARASSPNARSDAAKRAVRVLRAPRPKPQPERPSPRFTG